MRDPVNNVCFQRCWLHLKKTDNLIQKSMRSGDSAKTGVGRRGMTFVIRPPPPSVGGMCLIYIGYLPAGDWWPPPYLNLCLSKLDESSWSASIAQESIQCDAFMDTSIYIDWMLLESAPTTLSTEVSTFLKIAAHTSLCCSQGSSLWNSGGHGGQQSAQDEEADLPRAGLPLRSRLQRQDSRFNKPPALCHKGEAAQRARSHRHLLWCGACGGGPT